MSRVVECKVERYDKGNRYCRIKIPKENRDAFPEKGEWFTIKSESIEDKVRVMEDAPRWIPHIHLNMTKFFKANPELEDGNTLHITVTELNSIREYRLEIVK